jgi:hypothetical protein
MQCQLGNPHDLPEIEDGIEISLNPHCWLMLNLRVVFEAPSPTITLTPSLTGMLLVLTPINEKLDMFALGDEIGDLICAHQRTSHFS